MSPTMDSATSEGGLDLSPKRSGVYTVRRRIFVTLPMYASGTFSLISVEKQKFLLIITVDI